MALTDNLKGYWKLDESSGNAVDSLGINTLVNTNTLTYVAGKIGNCALSDQVNSRYLVKTSPSSLPSGAVDVTLNIWANPSSEPSLSGWGFGTAGTSQAGTILFGLSGPYFGGYSNDVYVSQTIPTNEWHMHTITIKASTKKVNFYYDGSHIGTEQTLPNTPNYGSGAVWIGPQGTWNTTCFPGKLDEAGIWQSVLTQEEITALYNGGAGLTYPFTPADPSKFFQLF